MEGAIVQDEGRLIRVIHRRGLDRAFLKELGDIVGQHLAKRETGMRIKLTARAAARHSS